MTAESQRRAPRQYRLRTDQPAFRLKAGDRLVCIPYWLNPDKVTVLNREPDGYDPSCTLNLRDLEAI